MPTIHKGAENKPGDTSNSRIIGLSEQPHTKYLAHLIVLVVVTTYLLRAIKNNHLSLGFMRKFHHILAYSESGQLSVQKVKKHKKKVHLKKCHSLSMTVSSNYTIFLYGQNTPMGKT